MKKQMIKMGFSYDWNREIKTCDHNYYKWEQKFFKKLYLNNLVYKKYSYVNWCNIDKTVLANEQVKRNKCWRCGKKIIKKKIIQWYARITKYSQELLNDLNRLRYWPEKVKVMQKKWIGRVEGYNIYLKNKDFRKYLNIYIDDLYNLINLKYLFITYDNFIFLEIKNITKCNIVKKIKKNFLLRCKNSFFNPITKEKIKIVINNFIFFENVNKLSSFYLN